MLSLIWELIFLNEKDEVKRTLQNLKLQRVINAAFLSFFLNFFLSILFLNILNYMKFTQTKQ